ncbi:MAG: hypothetical protein DCF15_03465 [Phormidesmis priestleyi]|uniref:Outer membrane protein beta-barrel domain-containing protein n=1 Tax=Phormidesmis priestleyi TaxID=268141 RepID=A0A2W4XQ84_9CYAN|nr:MAG: hypothetical protein DCF15_03465 [Phormidesmis priestleyi]
MKFSFSRISATLAIAAAALIAIPFGAQAQQSPDYSYVGLAGGDNGLTVNSKISVYDNVSLRPEVSTDFTYNDDRDLSFFVPVTYDFNSVGSGRTAFNPFIGAGVAGDIGNNSRTDFALTAGADYRFANRYVANSSVHYKPFADSNELDFTAGIGYTFR